MTTTGATIAGPQITSDYASNGTHDYKRVAIPLPEDVTATDDGPGGGAYQCVGGQVVLPK